MNDLYEALKKLEADPDARGVLTEIAATEGSSPRRAGSRMLLLPDGSFAGTIGGGTLEYHAQADARLVMASGKPLRKIYSLGDGAGEPIGSICGGSAVVDIRPISPDEAAVLLLAMEKKPRVLLFGAGHVGKALADVLHLLELDVVVTDERAELLTPERFPHAVRRVVPAEETAVDAEASDLVVVTTHSHAYDYLITLRALRSPARYVGMIGSRKKNALFRSRFLRDGISQADIDTRLHSPVGLPIGAETPEEIAVSIAAELIAELHI